MDNNVGIQETIQKVQIVKEPPKFQAQCLGCFKKFPKEDIKHFFCPKCYAREIENKDKNPTVAGLLALIPGLRYYYCKNTNRAKGIAESFIGLLAFGCFFPLIWIMLFIRMGSMPWSYLSAPKGSR
ncbi:hypothetical protein [Methanosarcina sp.]|uniref:hypothetical protein n=1 Tax=Methanosarcina sp. TaxID=2213 RepID=UPI003C760607